MDDHPIVMCDGVICSLLCITGCRMCLTDNVSCVLMFIEMFLRVMSLCHTVVVEKDIDKKKESIGAASPAVKAAKSPTAGGNAKNSDGAPVGFAYQAESPDEGALVSAASSNFGFQVISRDSSGIRLRREVPSHLDDSDLVRSLQSRECTMDHVAMETAHGRNVSTDAPNRSSAVKLPREETWTILATNKFDSDRKRMSILLRAPSELGSVPILFCKGADSAMLDSEICGITVVGGENENNKLSSVPEDQEMEEDMEHLLRMQVRCILCSPINDTLCLISNVYRFIWVNSRKKDFEPLFLV
jgi:magnesium-transporting ATPase (P-type)